MSRVAALLLATLPALAHAQGDPLASPECEAARTELDHALNGLVNEHATPRDRLAAARARAAKACLGGDERGRKRAGAPEPPLRVAPPVITDGTQLPKLEQAPPPLVIPRPTIVTTCDASGCWDSEGRRLNNAGPVLMGPRGLCSGTGLTVSCP